MEGCRAVRFPSSSCSLGSSRRLANPVIHRALPHLVGHSVRAHFLRTSRLPLHPALQGIARPLVGRSAHRIAIGAVPDSFLKQHCQMKPLHVLHHLHIDELFETVPTANARRKKTKENCRSIVATKVIVRFWAFAPAFRFCRAQMQFLLDQTASADIILANDIGCVQQHFCGSIDRASRLSFQLGR